MDGKIVNKVLTVKTTCTIDLECQCGGKFVKVYGVTDKSTNRDKYKCNRCKDEVYLNKDYTPITMTSTDRKIVGTEQVYINKPYVCSCGGTILYIGNNPGRCLKCNKTFEV